MTTLGREKKLSISIYDYPEHLNPFNEEDNVGKLHFWNIGKKKSRSNSFSLTGFKDLRNTWSFKSFTKKGRREIQEKAQKTSSSATNSPIVYRKPLNGNSSSVQTLNRVTENQPQANRYVYSGSVTPLPRIRVHERGSISNTQPNEMYLSPGNQSRRTSAPGGSVLDHSLPSLNELKVENHGSQTSLQSNTPFEKRTGSIRASSRKKRRAPPPPPPQRISSIPDTPCIVVTDTATNTIHETTTDDIDIDDPSLNVELKIVEDIDGEKKESDSDKITAAKTDINECEKEIVKDRHSVDTPITKIEQPKDEINECVSVSKTENFKASISIESDDSVFEHSEKKEEIIKEDINFVLQKISVEDDSPEELFQKVDIVTYKKSISTDTQEGVNSDDELKCHNTDSNNIELANVSEDNLNNNLSDCKKAPEINADSDIQKLKCKVIDCEGKYNVNRASARSEFFQTDKISNNKEDIIEVREKIAETNTNYQRRTVSDMKQLFDNPNNNDSKVSSSSGLNSPNPIPKPRRTRLESKKSSSSESYKAESPCFDVEEKPTLKL